MWGEALEVRSVAATNVGFVLLSLGGILLEAVDIEVLADLFRSNALGVAHWQRTQGEASAVTLLEELVLMLNWAFLHAVFLLVWVEFLLFLRA